MPALRAHHLLCLLTYAGTGYSPAFVRHFDEVAGRIAAGEPVTLAPGPDTLCAPVCMAEGGDAHCHGEGVIRRDEQAARELEPLLGPPDAGGWVLTPARVAVLRAAFDQGVIRGACEACPWAPLCTQVAQSAYAGARLYPPPP